LAGLLFERIGHARSSPRAMPLARPRTIAGLVRCANRTIGLGSASRAGRRWRVADKSGTNEKSPRQDGGGAPRWRAAGRCAESARELARAAAQRLGRAEGVSVRRLRARQEWQLFAVLPRADRELAVAWWVVLALRGVLPAVFAIAMGLLIAAVQRRS